MRNREVSLKKFEIGEMQKIRGNIVVIFVRQLGALA